MLVYRKAVPQDAQELCALNLAFNGEGSSDAAAVEASLRNNTQELVRVAEVDGHLVGFVCAQTYASVCYKGPEAHISELYVDDAYRRQGIGQGLMKEIEKELRARGIREAVLSTGGDNSAAQCLYSSLGYTASDDIIYEREL